MKRYEEIPHTADLAAKIYGKDLKELFMNAAFAMFDLMSNVPEPITQNPEQLGDKTRVIEVGVTAKTNDIESLLIAWLNELLYLSFRNKLIFCDFEIDELKPGRIAARASGAPLEKEKLRCEIKAATYHDVRIVEQGGLYEVVIVFDV